MPRFVTQRSAQVVPDNAEQLFQLLRRTDTDVDYLWSHQADTLRNYHAQALDQTDVTIELPTGSGKTLVGLLLAEWRRRARRERTAYLCPTIHLVRQVAERAAGYGIACVVLTGSNREWDPVDHTAYMRGNATAVTTYSTVFNTSPRLDDAQLLLLDDAHSGEGPVAAPWSISATRDSALYRAIVEIVSTELPEAFAERLDEASIDPRNRGIVEMLGPHQLAPYGEQLRAALDVHAEGEAAYARHLVRNAVDRCLMYVSWRELLIRPLIPPTQTHRAFAGANQRIYLSATLGAGGELERSFGIRSALRLPVPAGWGEQGSGRRFFLFPDAALDAGDADRFTTEAILRAGRALAIAPSRAEAEKFQQLVPNDTPVLSAGDFEADPGVIRGHERAVAVLANRYDGTDLPDDSCRLIILTGLPSATHLQERFLYERLGAQRVLAERIRTRIVQGAGRCTRNASDYAAVIARGDALTAFLSRTENVKPMQPDLQAEIEFGLDNSERGEANLDDTLQSFLDQDDDWREADVDIRNRSREKRIEAQPGAPELADAVQFEVDSWHAAWRGDLAAAANLARQAADRLGGSAVSPYRCLWLYLAASWSLSQASDTDRAQAEALAADAVACARSLLWRPRFRGRDSVRHLPAEYSLRDERAASVLNQLGLRGLRFDRFVAELTQLIGSSQHAQFEAGLEKVGELLGFESVRPTGRGQPDGAWRDGRQWLVFEAKSEALPENPVSIGDVRQALSHKAWLENVLHWESPEYAITCLLTDQDQIESEAAAIAEDLCVVAPGEMRRLAEEAVRSARSVRAQAPGLDETGMAQAFAAAFRSTRLDTATIALRMADRQAKRMRPRPRF